MHHHWHLQQMVEKWMLCHFDPVIYSADTKCISYEYNDKIEQIERLFFQISVIINKNDKPKMDDTSMVQCEKVVFLFFLKFLYFGIAKQKILCSVISHKENFTILRND